ncbi:MAG: 16S rRNA (cytosine(967)-C(5))-methyltransferase RsmB [Candidatus Schekmanbacteria bacterium]|nr:16S rRNA (cytosine(967)-C(5))-methyltransferase RsmB [Candidatus Schekmanbacteria bacterium]
MKKQSVPAARELALKILQAIETQNSSANLLILEVYQKYPLSPQDKALLKELVNGVLRLRLKLDWVLNYLTGQRLKKTHPAVLNILRLGAYQLLFLKGITPYAAVNESVTLARRYGYPGSNNLVNAVLRKISTLKALPALPAWEENPVLNISVDYSHPEWLIRRWIKRWGVEKTKQICAGNNQPAITAFRVNTLKTTLAGCQERLLQENIVTAPHISISGALEVVSGVDFVCSRAYQDGCIEIQSPCSQSVGQVLDPKPGQRVLDLCAGRGVKSTHLAQLMQNQGWIEAIDINSDKLRQNQANCRRLGINTVHGLCADAAVALPIASGQKYDRILIDAPCSGLGVLGRYPEARWYKSPELIDKMPVSQGKLLAQAAPYLANDGVLVYATCSLEEEENEQVIEGFLKTHPGWQSAPIITDGKACNYWHSWTQKDFSDGFFVAKLTR